MPYGIAIAILIAIVHVLLSERLVDVMEEFSSPAHEAQVEHIVLRPSARIDEMLWVVILRTSAAIDGSPFAACFLPSKCIV